MSSESLIDEALDRLLKNIENHRVRVMLYMLLVKLQVLKEGSWERWWHAEEPHLK